MILKKLILPDSTQNIIPAYTFFTARCFEPSSSTSSYLSHLPSCLSFSMKSYFRQFCHRRSGLPLPLVPSISNSTICLPIFSSSHNHHITIYFPEPFYVSIIPTLSLISVFLILSFQVFHIIHLSMRISKTSNLISYII